MNTEPSGNPPISNKGTNVKMVSVTLVWTTIVVGLTLGLISYSSEPDISGSPSVKWPKDIDISLSNETPTLLMFMHPHCPCTRASLGELELIMARCQGKVRTYAVLVRPDGVPDNWEKGYLQKAAGSIPGVETVVDNSGRLARRFYSATSGVALLYDVSGQLIFHGGITSSRGHSGDNAGKFAIIDLVYGRSPQQVSTPVFGCALLDSVCELEETH